MRYHWGHGVGHTYSHHFLKRHKSVDEIQTDVEMEDSPARSTASIRGGPSPLGSTGLNNGDDFDDDDENSIKTDDYENYDTDSDYDDNGYELQEVDEDEEVSDDEDSDDDSMIY
jgi:hypothetical protein